MSKNVMCQLFLLTCLKLVGLQPGRCQDISNQKIFFYYAALSGLPKEMCVDRYGSCFDTHNYNQSNSDEFEKKRYREKTRNTVAEGIRNINFSDKFESFISAKFGEYSFTTQSFPIEPLHFRVEKTFVSKVQTPNSVNANTYSFYLNDDVINQDEFPLYLKLPEKEATELISRKKEKSGFVNRTLTLRVIYSILNRPSNIDTWGWDFRFKGYVHFIEIYDNTKLLGTLSPSYDYYDKKNGVKIKDGEEILYFKNYGRSHWSYALTIQVNKFTKEKEGANYYRAIKFMDGKIIDVKDYYISGHIAMKGSYWTYSADPQYANGQFTWYHENGNTKQQINYENGLMEGCFYGWEKDGKCVEWWPSQYVKKDMPYTDPACACKDLNSNLQIENKSNSSNKGSINYIVKIGNQVWMAENLNVTTYRNGDPIPQVTDPGEWDKLTTGVWCYYNNDPANEKVLGKLYNWYAVNDPRGLAPQGWHVPTDAEWTALTIGLGGVSVAGTKMKSTGTIQAKNGLWESPNTGATNSSGFAGVPGGTVLRKFFSQGIIGAWWTSTEKDQLAALCRLLIYNEEFIRPMNYVKRFGLSVRCIED